MRTFLIKSKAAAVCADLTDGTSAVSLLDYLKSFCIISYETVASYDSCFASSRCLFMILGVFRK